MSSIEDLFRAHIRGVREAIAEATSRADALEALVNKVVSTPKAEPLETYRHNGWSKREDEIITSYYPDVGAVGCSDMLPHRSLQAIRNEAHRLGVFNRADKKRKVHCDQCAARVTYGQVASCQSKFCTAKALIASGAVS